MSERRAADWIKTRRELLDAATEGPWFQGRTGRRYESDRDVYSKREPDEENSHDIATYVWSADDAALIADARSSLPLALDALEAVLARHQPIEHGPNTGWVGEPWDECRTCLGEWPCATVDAIETALAGGCRECRQTDGHHKLDCGRRF